MHPVLVFTDEVMQRGGWHGEQLAMAFSNKGVDVQFASLKEVLLDISHSGPQLNGLGMPKNPQRVFVRGISGGTLQQITMRLNILHILTLQGATVMNDGRAIERTVDKAMTSFLLSNAQIATPPTWVCESRQHAHALIKAQLDAGQPLLLKPLFGSQGRGIRLITAQSELPLPMDTHVDGVFYLQQFIETAGSFHDFRVLVVQGEPIAAMRRNGQSWLNNIAQGADCEPTKETEILALACQAAKALGIAYCGVDILRDRDGKLWVLEVNSIPAWRALQSVTNFNIAQVLADALLTMKN